jgi:hypothetical protein
MPMSLLSSVGLTSAIKSEGPWFESTCRQLTFNFCKVIIYASICFHTVSTAIDSIMNAIGRDRFIVGENSGYANITN